MSQMNTIVGAIDELLQPAGFQDLGPNGLQVPGARRVTRVVTGVTAPRELIERAVELGAQLVLVHHGLFWDFHPTGLTPLLAERLRPLFRHDINARRLPPAARRPPRGRQQRDPRARLGCERPRAVRRYGHADRAPGTVRRRR